MNHEDYRITIFLKKSLILLGWILVEVVFLIAMIHYLQVSAKKNQSMQQYDYFLKEKITQDMKCFPIPKTYFQRISYEDTYNAKRIQGGHEGCDIMDLENRPNEIPVISCTDGEITNMGWLYLGGYRIGITSENQIYYYYAHLSSYAENLSVGDFVCAGQLLGFMGNTGEGDEGSSGNFPTHLHFGIYDYSVSEKGLNPYPYLKRIH